MKKLSKQILRNEEIEQTNLKNRVKKKEQNLPGQRKYTYIDILQEKNRKKWNKNVQLIL